MEGVGVARPARARTSPSLEVARPRRDGALAALQDTQHPDGFRPIGARARPGRDAFEEVGRLLEQRLRRPDGERYACSVIRYGVMAAPLDGVRIEDELVGRREIVKDGHLPLADDDQLLLFERVEPGDEEVRAHAARK